MRQTFILAEQVQMRKFLDGGVNGSVEKTSKLHGRIIQDDCEFMI